ncbi:hypothetical protein ACH5RR_018649 [Cinchona calisaya]|uniref:Uncharacterized protein n=1 Tax=Cinchona calisaya TaxID=153742 RepID=A0ABD2ZQP8_9GENT
MNATYFLSCYFSSNPQRTVRTRSNPRILPNLKSGEGSSKKEPVILNKSDPSMQPKAIVTDAISLQVILLGSKIPQLEKEMMMQDLPPRSRKLLRPYLDHRAPLTLFFGHLLLLLIMKVLPESLREIAFRWKCPNSKSTGEPKPPG